MVVVQDLVEHTVDFQACYRLSEGPYMRADHNVDVVDHLVGKGLVVIEERVEMKQGT